MLKSPPVDMVFTGLRIIRLNSHSPGQEISSLKPQDSLFYSQQSATERKPQPCTLE